MGRARTDVFNVRNSTTGRAVLVRIRSDEEGTSLIELVVGMVLMGIFLTMFTGAVVAMNRAENKTEAVSLTTSQLNQAFLALDKSVRYAAAISPPGLGTTVADRYVELRTTNTGGEVCTQLRTNLLDPTNPSSWQLQLRTWPVPMPGGYTPTWVPLASNIVNTWAGTGATQPFALKTAVSDSNAQQLIITLNTLSGGGSTQTPSLASYTFTAANSTIPAPNAPICQDQGRP